VVDLALLLARDHDQLDRAIGSLIEQAGTAADREDALDAARVSFAAHADAEAAVLYGALAHVASKHDVAGLVAQVLAAHRIQESILRRMDIRARSDDWMCASIRLRRFLLTHAEDEQETMMRTLRDCVPTVEYQRLAGAYATEKMRAIGLMSALSPVTRRGAIRGQRRAAR
jgi:hypothetical protein